MIVHVCLSKINLIVYLRGGSFLHKVLIVDDELFVRKGLINLIDWSSLQFQICGEAENGEQALNLIKQLTPDLVIVDIRMPVLDGLGLIRQVNTEEGHQPFFIILSGYPDFSYAQQAFRYNVSNYILKPVDEHELTVSLRKIANTLNQKQLLSMTREKPLVETVIESLVQAEPGEQVMMQIAHTLSLPLSSTYTYIIVEIQDKQAHGEIDYLLPLQTSLHRYFHLKGQPLLIHVRAYNQYGFIVPPLWQDEQIDTERMSYIKLLHSLEKDLLTNIALFIGNKVNHLRQIVDSRTSADECLNYRFAAGFNGIFMSSELLHLPLYYYDVDEGLHSKYFSGGLIPTYLLTKELGLLNSFWVYIIPGIIGVFNMIVIRSFIEGLPDGIMESAKIDGAGDFTTFTRIVLPLTVPALATVSLFVAVYQWNSWFDVFLYNSSRLDLSTLQYELMKILSTSNTSTSTGSAADAYANAQGNVTMVTPTSVRATMTIVASVPIILVYPFLQKYFVKGMVVGGVKG